MAVVGALSGSSQQLVTGRVTYYGFAIRETAGAAATVRIRDGGATGVILESIRLAPEESAREWYDGGIGTGGGIYVEVVAGTVEGSVRYG